MSQVLLKAHRARMKQSISECQNLKAVLEKIQRGEVPIDEMACARGLVAKLAQTVNEASAYHSAYMTMVTETERIPMSRPTVAKGRKRWKINPVASQRPE